MTSIPAKEQQFELQEETLAAYLTTVTDVLTGLEVLANQMQGFASSYDPVGTFRLAADCIDALVPSSPLGHELWLVAHLCDEQITHQSRSMINAPVFVNDHSCRWCVLNKDEKKTIAQYMATKNQPFERAVKYCYLAGWLDDKDPIQINKHYEEEVRSTVARTFELSCVHVDEMLNGLAKHFKVANPSLRDAALQAKSTWRQLFNKYEVYTQKQHEAFGIDPGTEEEEEEETE
jgi:hypothetical protein